MLDQYHHVSITPGSILACCSLHLAQSSTLRSCFTAVLSLVCTEYPESELLLLFRPDDVDVFFQWTGNRKRLKRFHTWKSRLRLLCAEMRNKETVFLLFLCNGDVYFRQLDACRKELCYSSRNLQLSHFSHSEGKTRTRDTGFGGEYDLL